MAGDAGGVAGTLQVGKRADLVLLDGPLDRSTLDHWNAAATLMGGALAHGSL